MFYMYKITFADFELTVKWSEFLILINCQIARLAQRKWILQQINKWKVQCWHWKCS